MVLQIDHPLKFYTKLTTDSLLNIFEKFSLSQSQILSASRPSPLLNFCYVHFVTPGLVSQMRTNQYVWKPLRGILPSCSLLGRSLPCTFPAWSPHPMLTSGQKPTENRRTKSCPGVGQCTEVRAWIPGKYPVIYMHTCLLASTKSAVAMYPTQQPTISFPIIYVSTMNTETRRDSFQ